MYEDEPRMLFGKPLSAMIMAVGTIVLFSQIICLMSIFLNIFFYFIVIMLCFGMFYLLVNGVKGKKISSISAYLIFLICYMMWVIIGTIFWVWLIIWELHRIYEKPSNDKNATTPDPMKFRTVKDGWLDFWLVLTLVSSTFTLMVSIYQVRLCILLQRHLKANNSTLNVSYHTRFGGPPPSWAPSPAPGTSAGGPAGNREAGPFPEKPPSYAQVTNPNPPVPVEQPISLAQSSTPLQPTVNSSNQMSAPPSSATAIQPASSSAQDDLDSILGRNGPPVIQTGSIMGGAFEAHSPTQIVEMTEFQRQAAPEVSVFSDPLDLQAAWDTVDVSSAVPATFVPSPSNPFAAEIAEGNSASTNNEISSETWELGLFEDIHLN